PTLAKSRGKLSYHNIGGRHARTAVFGRIDLPKDTSCRLGVTCGTCLGITEVVLESAGTVVVIIRDRVMADRGDKCHVLLGSRECGVQSALTPILVDRAEVHQHFSRGSLAVADAEDNYISFVALNVLKVLDEKTDELAVLLAFPLGLQPAAEVIIRSRQTL